MESSSQPDDVNLREQDSVVDKAKRRTVHLGSGINDELSKSDRRHKLQKQKEKLITSKSEENAKNAIDYLDSSDESSSEKSSDFVDSAEGSPSMTRKKTGTRQKSREGDTNEETTLEIQQDANSNNIILSQSDEFIPETNDPTTKPFKRRSGRYHLDAESEATSQVANEPETADLPKVTISIPRMAIDYEEIEKASDPHAHSNNSHHSDNQNLSGSESDDDENKTKTRNDNDSDIVDSNNNTSFHGSNNNGLHYDHGKSENVNGGDNNSENESSRNSYDPNISQDQESPRAPVTLSQRMLAISVERNVPLAPLVTMNEATKFFFQSFRVQQSKINSKDGDGNTPLHLACLFGQIEVVRVLLKRGAKNSEKNNKGITPLHYACSKNTILNILCAELLVLNGANVNAKTDDKETPLHFAVFRKGGDKHGNVACVQLLTRWKADVDMKTKSTQRLPLHYAAQHGFTQILNMLLERNKTTINAKDHMDYTPLHLAIMYGNVDCVQLLLLRGANVSAVAKDGSTCLHLACRYGRPQILDFLLNAIEKEKNKRSFKLVIQRDKHGFTPVHWAAVRGHHECLVLFPEFLSPFDSLSLTPICWSILNNHKLCINYLVSRELGIKNPVFNSTKSGLLHPMADELEIGINIKEFSDLKMRIEGKSIYVHKVVVSRCLKKFLKDNISERQKLRIKNVSYDTMMDFVKYLYTGIIPSKDTRVKELLRVANNFGLPLLRQICENELLDRGKQSYFSTVPQHLGNMLDKGFYSDCTVVVEGKTFHLHKFILASRCTFFQNEFAMGKKEIIIHDVSKRVFRGILDYLYTDTVRRLDTMLEEDFVQLFLAAKTLFKLPELMKKCEYYIYQRVDISTVVSIYQLIQDLEMPILRKATLDYMASELKRLTKLGHISTLTSDQLNELKKRKKEVKKALENEEKKSKKNTLKKMESFHNVPSPETFFLKRKVDAAMKPENREGKVLTRRNSSTW